MPRRYIGGGSMMRKYGVPDFRRGLDFNSKRPGSFASPAHPRSLIMGKYRWLTLYDTGSAIRFRDINTDSLLFLFPAICHPPETSFTRRSVAVMLPATF